MDDPFDPSVYSPHGLEVIGRMVSGESVDDELQGRLSDRDLDGIGRLLHSGKLKVTPKGTKRYGNTVTETGAAVGRGTLNLGAVPYDALAGVSALGANAVDIATGRESARPGWTDQQLRPGMTGRNLTVNRLETEIGTNARLIQQLRDKWNPQGVPSDAPQQIPQATGDQAFLHASTRQQDEAEIQRLTERNAALRQQWQGASDLNAPEALAVGAHQVGSTVRKFTDRTIPPSAADVVPGERSWYNPQRLLNVTAENAPQLAAQMAIAYTTGGASAAGSGSAAAARLAAFVGSGSVMELADAVNSQTEGFQNQGMSEIDALKKGAAPAAFTAAINTVFERLDAHGLLPKDPIARDLAKKGLIVKAREAILAGAKGGAFEGGTEMLQETTGAGMEFASGANPNALDPSNLIPRVVTAGVAGFGPGSIGGGVAGLHEQRAAARAPQTSQQTQQSVQGVPAGVGAPGGGVIGEVPQGASGATGAQVAVGADQGQSVPAQPDLSQTAAAMIAEAEKAGREDAAAGVPPQDLTGEHPEVVRAYQRGLKQGGRARVSTEQSTTDGGAAPTEVADPNTTPRQEPDHGKERQGREEGLLSPPTHDEIAAAGQGAEPTVNDATTPSTERPAPAAARLEDMSNTDLLAEAERLGVKPAKSRPTLIGRIREARSNEKAAAVQDVHPANEGRAVEGEADQPAPLSAVAPAVEGVVRSGGAAVGAEPGHVAGVEGARPSRGGRFDRPGFAAVIGPGGDGARKGPFGPIFERMKGKFDKALRVLRGIRDGEAAGALSHPDVPGPISLVWGKEGTSARNYEDGYGIAKIDRKHPGDLDKLPVVWDSLKRNPHKSDQKHIVLDDPTGQFRGVVRLEFNDQKKTWLVTFFDRNGQATAPGKRSLAPGNPASGAGGTLPPSVAHPNTMPPVPPGGKPLSVLDSIEQAALRRLNSQTIRPGGRGRGAPGGSVIGAGLRDVAIVAAVRVVKAGVRTAEAIHDAIKAVSEELGRTLTDPERKAVFREARQIVRSAGEKGASIEEAVKASRDRHPDETPASPVPDASVKSKVINTTGQRDAGDAKTVSEREAMRASGKAQERAGKAGFAAGVQEGKVKAEAAAAPRETLKQRIARVSGMTDAGDEKTVSQREALNASLKKSGRAATKAYREGRKAALAEFEIKVEAMRTAEGTARDRRVRLKTLVKELLPPELHKRFLHAIATTKTEKQLDAAATRVLWTLADYRAKKAVAEARAQISKAKPKQMLKGLRDIVNGYESAIEDLAGQLRAEKESRAEKEAKLRGYISAIAQVPSASRRASKRQQIETQLINEWAEHAKVVDAIRESLVKATGGIKEARAQQGTYNEIHRNGKRVERETVVNETIAHIERTRKDLKTEARDPKLGLFRGIGFKHLNRESFGNLLGGTLRNLLVTDIWKGENKVNTDIQAGADARQKAVEAIGEKWGGRGIRLWSETTGGEKAHKLTVKLAGDRQLTGTWAEWGDLYALLGDNDHRRKIMAGAPVVWQREQSTGTPTHLSRDDVNAIERAIPAPVKRVFDSLKEDYAKRVTPGEARAFREHYGYDMETFDGYWNAKRMATVSPESEEMTKLAKTRAALEQLSAHIPEATGRDPQNHGAWKERDDRATKAPYIIQDGFAHHADMVRLAAIRTHMTQPIRNLRTVLNERYEDGRKIKSAMDRYFGTGFHPLVKELVDDANLIGSTPESQGSVNSWVRKAQRNLSRAYLGLSPSAVMKNLGGVLKLVGEIDPQYLVKGLPAMTDRAVYDRMVAASPFFRHAHEQTAAVRATTALGEASDVLGTPTKGELVKRVAASLSSSFNPKEAARVAGELVDRLPFFGWGDSRASVVAWRALEHQAEDLFPNTTPAERLKWVSRRAEVAVRRTQNPRSVVDMTRAAIRHRGNLLGTMMMFTSDGLASLNLLVQAKQTSGYRSKKFARRLAGVALNMAWAAGVTRLLDDGVRAIAAALSGNRDEDKWARRRRSAGEKFARELVNNAGGLIYGGPWLADVGMHLFDLFTGKANQTTPELSFSPISASLGRLFKDAFETFGAFRSAMQDQSPKKAAAAWSRTATSAKHLATEASALFGVPATPLLGIARRASEGATATADKGVVVDAVEQILRGDSARHKEALEPLSMLFRHLPRDKWLDEKASLRNALIDKDPLGKMTAKERVAYLKTLDAATREKKVAAYRAWVKTVEKVLPAEHDDPGPAIRAAQRYAHEHPETQKPAK